MKATSGTWLGTDISYLAPARKKYECSFTALIAAARGSAAGLVNILARDFSCFRDEFPPAPGAGAGDRSRPVRFLKRAQILVADLWACFDGAGPGEFRDIDKITIFADYRIPQILASLGCIEYSPTLLGKITRREIIESGSSFEMQLRGKKTPVANPAVQTSSPCCMRVEVSD